MFYGKDRAILHLDLDTFFVSVERLRDSRLEGVPLIIGGKGDRGVVAACSYETRKFGVHSAMPMRVARQLCPQAMVISGDMEAYSQHSRIVTDIIKGEAPLFEKSSIDEFYLDLTGMDRFFGSYQWASELRSKISKESGLPLSFGLSINKMVSKVATGEAKPNGQWAVKRGSEKAFLAPMHISKIPMIGKKTCQLLVNMGIEKVITLSKIPPEMMARLLGKNGFNLWKRANGIDTSPVIPYTEAKSISAERTFQQDTMDIQTLRILIAMMVEKLAFKLRSSHRLTACVTVKIRYSNFDTVTKQRRISYASSDHLLISTAHELFESLYDRRMLLRLVGVRFSDFVTGHYQISLFEDTEEAIRLYQAIDRIKKKHGSHKIFRAAGVGIWTARPDVTSFMKE